jgi:S25 ribosomal protein
MACAWGMGRPCSMGKHAGCCGQLEPRWFAPATLQSTYDKLLAEVPKYKMITPSILSDRLRVSCRRGMGWHGGL